MCRPAIAEGCVCAKLRAEAALSAAYAYVYNVGVRLSGTNSFTGSVWKQGATHLPAYNKILRMGTTYLAAIAGVTLLQLDKPLQKRSRTGSIWAGPNSKETEARHNMFHLLGQLLTACRSHQQTHAALIKQTI